jgi:hypothetical protein
VRCSGRRTFGERNLGRIPGRARAAAYQMDIEMNPAAIGFAHTLRPGW